MPFAMLEFFVEKLWAECGGRGEGPFSRAFKHNTKPESVIYHDRDGFLKGKKSTEKTGLKRGS